MKARDLRRQMAVFRAYNESRGLSPRTIKGYETKLTYIVRWLIHQYGEDTEITGQQIRQFVAFKRAEGRMPNTLRCYVESLRGFYTFLVFDGVIADDQNPMRRVKTPRVPASQIEPLTPEETRKFLAAFDKTNLTDYRDYTACVLVLDTGLRVGEVVSLTLDDLDMERQRIKVMGKGRKRRTVFFGEKVKGLLADYIERCHPWIANGSRALFPPTGNTAKHPTIDPRTLSTAVRRKFDLVGIPRASSSAHRLRHTFAVSWIRNKGGVLQLQRILGHSKLDMTMRYVNFCTEDIQEAHRIASPVDHLDI